MNDRQWQEVWEIFRTAKELPAGALASYLDSASSDPEVLSEVAGMLEEQPEEAPPEPASRVGTRFGRYEIGEMLGSGGMGQVYAARDTELGRKVAVKFLSPEMSSSRAAVQRLMREAKAASALNHPHIVTVYEVTRSGDDTAIAMELVDGEAVRGFCGTPVEAAKVVDWGRQIAQALAAAHQSDIVHRDIKPENVMVRRDGILKVLDFDLARQAGGLGQASQSSAMLAGTLSYMAPEQIRGESATRASDIFSLGIVLYELAAGRHPFGGGSVIDTAHTIAHAGVKRPSSWNARLPPGFDALLLSMLHKDPHKRPPATEVDRRLAEFDLTARPVPWRRIISAAGALAAIAGGLWMFRFRELILPRKDRVMTQVTTQVHEDQITAAAISPDGKSLAFAALGGAVYLRRMSDGFTQPLSTPAGLRVDRISWFPDESKLLLSGSQEAGEAIEHYRPGVWVEPLNGADPVRVIENGRDASPSPDGTRIAFTGADQSAIWVSMANGEGRRQIADGGRTTIFGSLIWSPDGRRIATGRQDYESKADQQAQSNYQVHWNYRYSYQSLDIDTGGVTAKTDGLMITSACGLPDGRVFFLRTNSIETMPANQIWEMRTDLRTGRLLSPPRQVSHVTDGMLANISADNSGKDVVATLGANGYPNIYVADLSWVGESKRHIPRLSNIRRLTYTAASDYPHAWTPDNQAVIFESSPNSHFDLFRQRIDRRDREALVVSQDMKVMAQLTPDGQWLLYHQFVRPGILESHASPATGRDAGSGIAGGGEGGVSLRTPAGCAMRAESHGEQSVRVL